MLNTNKIKWNFSHYTDSHGRTYIISYYNQWDPKKKQSRIVERVHVGRLDETIGRVSCGKKYLERHPELIDQELFYEDNMLVAKTPEEINQISNEINDYSYRCDAISYGLTYACWEIAKKNNIISNLYEIFGDNGDELLRLAIYQLASSSQAMQNYEDWLCMNYLPSANPLTSQKISDILSKVTQSQVEQYFKLRHDRLVDAHNRIVDTATKQGKEIPPIMMAIDSTSISTYSETIADAAYGHAKQDDFLKQINLTLCVDYATGDTCYAYESEGSINDMALYPSLLMRMQNCGLDLSNVLLVTDRGYSSVLNIQKQIDCKLRFLTGIRLSEDSVKKMIDKYKASLSSPVFMGKCGVNARTAPPETWTSTVDGFKMDYKVYLHLYHDTELGVQQNKVFMQGVYKLLDIKNNNEPFDPNLNNKYHKYIVLNKRNNTWTLNPEAIEKACNYHGYFAIRTNEITDPFDSLSIYRERNIVETAFRQFKVLNEGERLYCTQTSYQGKIFVHLLAQTLRMIMSVSVTHNETRDNKLPGDSLPKLMLQLQKLQASKPAGRGIWIVKEIPKKTRDLFDLLNVAYPKKQVKN
jgi:hypothetical protein